MRSPKRAASWASSASWSWATVAYPSSARRSAVFGPIPGSRRVGRGGEADAGLLAPHGDEAGGLAEVRAALGDQPVGPDAGRDLDAGLLVDLVDQLAQHPQRLLDAGEIGVGLVEAHRLQSVQLGAHELPDLARLLAVGGEVGRDDDRGRAQPARLGGGHRGADAELARLVGGGRDDRARPGAGDDHRLALQLRAPDQLDRGVERVAVEVGDDALRSRPVETRGGPDADVRRVG